MTGYIALAWRNVGQWALAILALFAVIAMVSLYAAPKPVLYPDTKNSQAYYSSEGKLLRLSLSGDQQYRLSVSLKDIPADLQAATLLYEDQYFYSHHGVNLFSLLRATYSSYFSNGRRMGASTITMQLARLRFNLNTTRIPGKLNQIWQALILERHYSKAEILEAYFNLAPYGHNIQGIAAASLTYFHKQSIELTTAESLLLAVVPQNPNRRLPSTQAGYKQASLARERLIEMWLETRSLSNMDKHNLSQALLVHSPKQLPFLAPHFVDRLIQKTQNETLLQNDINSSTLSLELQSTIEILAKRYIEQNHIKGVFNTSVLVLDYTDMQIKAELGSVNYFNNTILGQVNGTRALRSPGSTLKPFIYALATEQGIIHPSSILKDTPKQFSAYSPENYDKQFTGPLSARDALVRSRNIPAVSLMNELKAPTFHEWLAQSNPRRLESSDHYGLSLALGGNEVSMLELVQWYATLANHGRFNIARSVIGPKNKQATPEPDYLLSPEASYLTLQMLSSNPRPRRNPINKALYSASDLSQNIPWKTGTSYAFRDAWSIGVVGQYVLAVWVGNFDGKANPAFIGRRAAAPLFFNIADHLQQHDAGRNNVWTNTHRLNLKQIEICQTSGDLDIEHCPDVKLDWFIPGISPIKSKRVFREIPIDRETGLRACNSHAGNTELNIFEFWPSDIARAFSNAGIEKKKPPPFMPGCDQFHQSIAVDAPDITSPNPSLTYALQSDRLDTERIPLTANVASDANKLYWFINNQYIGHSQPNQPLLWRARQGDFSVTVIDNVGRSSRSSVRTSIVN